MCIYVYMLIGTVITGVYLAFKHVTHASDSHSLEETIQAKPSEIKSDNIGREDKSLQKPNVRAVSQTSDIEELTPGRSVESMDLLGLDDFTFLDLDLSDDPEEKCSPIALLQERGGELRLDKEALRNLLNPDVLKDIPIAVISIAGAYRMGKSFLLNLLLRYFEKQGWNDGIDKERKGGWLKDWNSSQQNGIDWRGGSEGHTRGIVAWGKPIIVQRTDGRKVGMTCVWNDIPIQCFAEFSKIAKPKTESNVDSGYRETRERCFFQELVFLVRDWHSPKSFQYGHIGGNKYLIKILSCSGEENEAGVHRYLSKAFTKLSCFLMPEPDTKVRITEDDTQILRSSDLGDKFFNGVADFAFKYFHPDRIPTKSIAYLKDVTANDLLEFVEHCAEGVLNGDLPNFPTMMQGVTEYANVKAMEKAERNFKERFRKELEEMDEPTWEAFDDAFLKEKKRAVESFLQSTHYGSDVNRDQQKAWLMDQLERSKATMIEEMNRKRLRYTRAVVDVWLKESVSKLRKHRRYMYTEAGDLQNIKTDCLAASFRKDPRDCYQVTDILQEGEEKLEAACNENVRDVETRNSKVNHLKIGAIKVGVVAAASVAAGGFLLGQVMIGGVLASVTGATYVVGRMKRGLDCLWTEHNEKQKTD